MVGPIELVNHLHLWQSKPNMPACHKYKNNYKNNDFLAKTLTKFLYLNYQF